MYFSRIKLKNTCPPKYVYILCVFTKWSKIYVREWIILPTADRLCTCINDSVRDQRTRRRYMQQNNRLESFRRFNLTSSAAAGEELQSSRSKNVGSTRKKKSCGFYINRTHIPYIKEFRRDRFGYSVWVACSPCFLSFHIDYVHTVDLSIVRGPCTTVTDVLTIN